jgi:hypothetical protein
MRKILMIAVVGLILVFGNLASAQNYSISNDLSLNNRTFAVGSPKALFMFTIVDLDDNTFPPAESVVQSVRVKTPLGTWSDPYSFLATPPYDINEKPGTKTTEAVILAPWYISEFRATDKNKNGIMEPALGEYGPPLLTSYWHYELWTEKMPVYPIAGGTYTVEVTCTNNQIIQRDVTVTQGENPTSATNINAYFDPDGRFNVSWSLDDYYLSHPEATIEIRVDRYGKDGTKKYFRFDAQSLPVFFEGAKREKYTFFKWESDALRLYSYYNPYIKVQIRISYRNGRSASDWIGFEIGGSTPPQQFFALNRQSAPALMGSEVSASTIPLQPTVTRVEIPEPSNLTQTQIDQYVEGLSEIQTLINTPPGKRTVTGSYSGQLGEQMNIILQMLLPPGKAKK